MRPIERIPIVMKLMFSGGVRNLTWLPSAITLFIRNNNQINIPDIINSKYDIMYYWMQNPDQRFGQVLFNLGLSDDSMYNVEEDDWLIQNGYCNIEDVKFWTSNLDINDRPLPTPRKILLKDLDINHIRNIITFFENRSSVSRINGKYLEYFDERIYDDKHVTN